MMNSRLQEIRHVLACQIQDVKKITERLFEVLCLLNKKIIN